MTRRPHVVAGRLLLLAVCFTVSLAAVAPPAHARPTCFGKPATIVSRREIVRGTQGADVIVGGARDQTIYGLRGNDRICGRDGKDILYPGAGRDKVDGEGAPPIDPYTCQSSPNSLGDILSFRDGRGPVTVSLLTGVATGRGRDILRGIETVVGGPSDDTIQGDDGPNCLHGVEGSHTISGAGGNDFLLSFGTDDTMYGDDGADVLNATSGNDTMFGGNGDDFLYGGDGIDTADGGPHDTSQGDLCWAETVSNCER